MWCPKVGGPSDRLDSAGAAGGVAVLSLGLVFGTSSEGFELQPMPVATKLMYTRREILEQRLHFFTGVAREFALFFYFRESGPNQKLLSDRCPTRHLVIQIDDHLFQRAFERKEFRVVIRYFDEYPMSRLGDFTAQQFPLCGTPRHRYSWNNSRSYSFSAEAKFETTVTASPTCCDTR
jgi:hypothetical protein